MRILVVAALALAACEQPMPEGAGPGPVAMSGSRLKLKSITGADGSRSVSGFRDTKLNVDCDFAQAEDGELRCLPTQAARDTWTMGEPELLQLKLYADEHCTERAVGSSLCSPPVRYARFADGCGGQRVVLVAEVPTTNTTAVYTFGPGGGCARRDAGGLLRLYKIGTPVAPTEFVAGMAD